MSYAPKNQAIFSAALAGALAGMGVSGRVLTSVNPADYTGLAIVAGAFAQALDTAWGVNPATDVEVATTGFASEAAWEGRSPQNVPPNDSPANYTTEATAIVTAIQSSVAYLAGQGVVTDYDNQLTWELNPTTGSNSNSGAPGSPILTLAEFCRRVTVFNPTGYVINVVGGGDIPITDSWEPSGKVAPGTSLNEQLFTLIGQEKVLSTSTATATATRSNYESGTNLQATFTDATVVSWAPFVGKQIVIATGPAAGAKAVILADLGAGVARIVDLHSDAAGFIIAANLPVAGNGYRIVDYTTFGAVNFGRGTPGGVCPTIKQFSFPATNPSPVVLSGEVAPLYVDCLFGRLPSFANQGAGIPGQCLSNPAFQRCAFVPTSLSTFQTRGPSIFFTLACGFVNCIVAIVGSGRFISMGSAMQASALDSSSASGLNPGSTTGITVGGQGIPGARFGLGVFSSPAGRNGILIAKGGLLMAQAISCLGGSGNALFGLANRDGGRVFLPLTPATNNGLTGASGELQQDGVATAMPPLEASAGAVLPALSALATWANLYAAPFSGNAMNYKTGSILAAASQ
jgi:hypothetical protein